MLNHPLSAQYIALGAIPVPLHLDLLAKWFQFVVYTRIYEYNAQESIHLKGFEISEEGNIWPQ